MCVSVYLPAEKKSGTSGGIITANKSCRRAGVCAPAVVLTRCRRPSDRLLPSTSVSAWALRSRPSQSYRRPPPAGPAPPTPHRQPALDGRAARSDGPRTTRFPLRQRPAAKPPPRSACPARALLRHLRPERGRYPRAWSGSEAPRRRNCTGAHHRSRYSPFRHWLKSPRSTKKPRGLACQPVNRSRPRQSSITVARARRQRLVAWRRAARTPTRLAPPPPCSPAPRKRLGGGMGLD